MTKAVITLVLFVTGVFLLACGDDAERPPGKFGLDVQIDRFAGPVPHRARFVATARNAYGDVLYRWRFDDGTTSHERAPVHTFRHSGYYRVIVEAWDEAGHEMRQTYLLGAWRRRDWKLVGFGFNWDRRVARIQRAQQRRTKARHMELRAAVRRRAREQTPG